MAGLKRVLVALVILAAVGVGGYYTWHWYDSSRDVQTTDDAYVNGEITSISSRVSGYAVEVLVDDNYPVKAAQVLARIDPRDFRMAVEKAQAAIEQAQAKLADVDAQRYLQKSKIAVAEAELRSAQAQVVNADVTLRRARSLAQQNYGTQAAEDTATAADADARSKVDQATANLAYEQEQVKVIDANDAIAKADFDAAESALLQAKFALADTEVWSPIDGVVANLQTRVGEFVPAGSHMLSVVPLDNLWIDANYRETQIEHMAVGDPVRVSLDAHPGTLLCGYVESIAPASGSEFALVPADNATGNFTKIVRRLTVRIRFNAREANAHLARPGMSVETAVAVPLAGGDDPAALGRRIGCAFDPKLDMIAHTPTRLPAHPGLGRARPQGESGVTSP